MNHSLQSFFIYDVFGLVHKRQFGTDAQVAWFRWSLHGHLNVTAVVVSADDSDTTLTIPQHNLNKRVTTDKATTMFSHHFDNTLTNLILVAWYYQKHFCHQTGPYQTLRAEFEFTFPLAHISVSVRKPVSREKQPGKSVPGNTKPDEKYSAGLQCIWASFPSCMWV